MSITTPGKQAPATWKRKRMIKFADKEDTCIIEDPGDNEEMQENENSGDNDNKEKKEDMEEKEYNVANEINEDYERNENIVDNEKKMWIRLKMSLGGVNISAEPKNTVQKDIVLPPTPKRNSGQRIPILKRMLIQY